MLQSSNIESTRILYYDSILVHSNRSRVHPASFKMIGAIFGNGVGTPLPIVHFFFPTVTFTNTYLLSGSIAFQVWYWTQALFV